MDGEGHRRSERPRRPLHAAWLSVCMAALLAASAVSAAGDGPAEAPETAPTVASLIEALHGAAAAAMEAFPRRPEAVMLLDAPDAPLLDAYATRVLAGCLTAHGVETALFAAHVRTAGSRPGPLPAPIVRALHNRSATVLIRVAVAGAAAARQVGVDVYDAATGRVAHSLRVAVQLSEEQADLSSRRRQELDAADADWLRLLEAAFGPGAPAPEPPRDPVAIAEALFFLEAGLWDVAADRFLDLAPAGPNACFMRGVFALHMAGRPDDAIARAEAARRDHPESGPVCALLAWLNLRRGRQDNAVLLLEQARLSDMTREGLYHYAEALMALESGNEEAAQSRLTRAAALLPACPFVHVHLARFHRNRGRLAEAVACYRLALGAGDGRPETWAELAMALRALGRDEEALRALREAFAITSGSIAINRQLAAILRLQGRHEDALDVLRRAAQTHPHDPGVLAAYGDAALQMWRTEDARRAFEDAAALNSRFPYASVQLTNTLAARREHAQARTILEALLAEQPEYAPARIALGRLLGRMDRFEEAVRVLEASTVQPDHEADARLALAEVHMAAGRASDAVASAQIAASSRPDARSFATLSRAFLAAGEPARAETAARTGLEHDARSDAALLALASALDTRNHREEAVREAERALAANPYSVEALETAGRLALDGDDAERCVEFWQKALELNPWNAELHLQLGLVLGRRLDRWEAARDHLVRYAELGQQHAQES